MSTNKTKTYSNEAIAIAEAFKANPGKKMTFAEACSIAGVPTKSGYLKAVTALLGADNLAIGEKDMEIEVVTKVKRNSYTYTPAQAE